MSHAEAGSRICGFARSLISSTEAIATTSATPSQPAPRCAAETHPPHMRRPDPCLPGPRCHGSAVNCCRPHSCNATAEAPVKLSRTFLLWLRARVLPPMPDPAPELLAHPSGIVRWCLAWMYSFGPQSQDFPSFRYPALGMLAQIISMPSHSIPVSAWLQHGSRR